MIRIAALAALFLLSIPCVASAQPERVTCPDAPEQGRETWVLEDLWRVGADDSDEVIFGTISQAVMDADADPVNVRDCFNTFRLAPNLFVVCRKARSSLQGFGSNR